MYSKTVLDNGLRIVSESIPYMSSISMGVYTEAGSRMESSKIQGISHFLEHMMFKGTKNRTARDIAEAVDNVGGQLNAGTDRESTCYYIKVLAEHLELGMDVLSDMLRNSLFSTEDIERERQVVLEEINLYEDSADELIHDLHFDSAWPKHPLGHSVLGKRETISSLTRADLTEYVDKYYKPDNMIIAAAGRVDHAELVDLVNKYWGTSYGTSEKIKLTAPQFIPATILQEKDIEQVHLCLGTPGVHYGSPNYYTMHVLNTILGGGVSSRLFQTIREERGLAYSVYSYPSTFRDIGLLTIYTAVSPDNASAVLELIRKLFAEIQQGDLKIEELTRAKEQLKAGLLFSLESSASRMSRLGRTEMCERRYLPLEELVSRVEAVTMDDLNSLAKSLFTDTSTCLTALGPISAAGLKG